MLEQLEPAIPNDSSPRIGVAGGARDIAELSRAYPRVVLLLCMSPLLADIVATAEWLSVGLPHIPSQ